MSSSKTVTRKWEVFPGRNRFFCNGRLMAAPHLGLFYLNAFLVTGTCVLFFVFECPYLTVRITPAVPAIGALLFATTICSLLMTAFSDPGVIPRATREEETYIEKQIEVPNSCNSPTLRPPPRTKEVLVNGEPIKLKYCYTCKMFRPPRASHCSLCDNCIDRFDHHCPWVGNCVGKRNYRYFYTFIVSLAFLNVFIFSCAITHIVLLVRDPPGGAILDALRASPASAVVSCICFLSVWSVLGMAGFHTYLISTNQTTNEDIKGSFASKRGQETKNPFSRGSVCGNCSHILCGPMTPSLIDRRGVLTNEVKLELEAAAARVAMPPPIVTVPYPVQRPMPVSSVLYDAIDPGEASMQIRTGSYTNLYRLEERDSEVESSEAIAEMEMETISPKRSVNAGKNENHLYSNIDHSKYMNHNLDLDPVVLFGTDNKIERSISDDSGILIGTKNLKGTDGHLYSNVSHLGYMNHNLDLDPVVLTGSKENLVSAKESSQQQRIEMMHKIPVRYQSKSFDSVSLKREKDSVITIDELNHNTIGVLPAKTEMPDPNMNVQEQMWAERLPHNENGNNVHIAVISEGKMKMSHDSTMIDTALDLDSLNGSTLSLWNAV